MTDERQAGLREAALEELRSHHDYIHTQAAWETCESCGIVRAALVVAQVPAERGTCWFCKGEFVVDALIAGYDTWDEQRLACLACNERMTVLREVLRLRPIIAAGNRAAINEQLGEVEERAQALATPSAQDDER